MTIGSPHTSTIPPPRVDTPGLRLRHVYRVLRQDLPKLSLLRDRHVHGHIVTMQQSGTHWLTHILAAAMAEVYGVPGLSDIDDRSLIGDHKRPAVYPHVPRLIQTHNIPSPLCHAWPLRRVLSFPKYVILLRDMRASLVSHYEKHHARAMPFSDYLRNGRVIGNRVRWDLWYRIRFLNAWDREIRRLPPTQTLVTHYESVQADPLAELQRVWTFFHFPAASPEVFARAVAASTKDRMSQKESRDKQAKVIRKDSRHPFEWFSADDRAYFEAVCRSYLRDPCGYDYHQWESLFPQPQGRPLVDDARETIPLARAS